MIDCYLYENGWDGINKDELSDVIEDAFDKKLADNFFDVVDPKYVAIAEEEGRYVGAVIVEDIDELKGIDYVNKLAVIKEKQKNGVANRLMDVVDAISHNYVLRADSEKTAANLFYNKRGERGGDRQRPLFCTEGKDWNIYYPVGVLTNNLREKAVRYALDRPVTLI